MQIHVEIKTIYGEERVYPACERARLFARLAGTKTLTRQALGLIEQLGYQVVPVSIGGYAVMPLSAVTSNN